MRRPHICHYTPFDTAIGNWAFDECEALIEVTIPVLVTSVSTSAFYDCTSLVSLESAVPLEALLALLILLQCVVVP